MSSGEPQPQFYPIGSAEGLTEARRRIAEAQSTHADEINLGGLGLTAVPNELLQLTQLKVLYLGLRAEAAIKPYWKRTEEDKKSCNAMSALPPAFFTSLRHLTLLYLEHNRLAALPETINRLTKLDLLSLDNNQLTVLPDAIGQLAGLGLLLLANNRLAVLPDAIGRLTNLERLYLDYNQLRALPSAIGQLANLKTLYLDDNQLVELPEAVGQLASLKRLWLNNNKLTALPEAIGQLVGIEELCLDDNQLAVLPEVIGQLANLEELWLNNNQLAALPEAIGQLASLKELSLRDNQLAALPEAIGRLANLRGLSLHNNQLITPPQEVAEQGLDAIRAYFDDLGNTGEPLYEAKIVLVGEGAVGKTTLKERLIHDRFLDTPHESTRGLEMEAAPRPHPGKPAITMTLNFWDFGGQEDYRPAQQFFFSRGALYIMVWHARDDANRSDVEAWMRLIRHRVGPDARVLVVATNADAHTPGVSVSQLCGEKFKGMVAGFHEVDSKSGKGIAELWQAIEREVVTLGEFGAKRPKSWIDARDAILKERERAHQMPIGKFREIAAEKGVSEEAIETFAVMLTLQGRIVWHGDDPHLAGTVVLDPEWLMKAIAYVVTDKETKDRHGILPETSLARIWLNHARAAGEKPIRYHKEHWNHLLRMMDRHDIVYQLTKADWLVAPLVPLGRPRDLPWDGRRPNSHGTPLRVECRLDDEIPGLMALLTVRTHYYHYDFQRYCWREGVLLRDPLHEGTLALIEAADGGKCIRIATTGHFAPNLMERLAGGLETLIHEMWPGGASVADRPYQFVVPCPTDGCPGYYYRDDLFRDQRDGEENARCNKGHRCRHDIHTLLTGQPAPYSMAREVAEMRHEMRGGFDGVLGRLDDVRLGIGDILGYVSNEAPRIYSLRPVDPKWWDVRGTLLEKRVEVQVWCEESNRPVDGAVEVVTFDQTWVKYVRRYAPYVRKLLGLAVAAGGQLAGAGLLGRSTATELEHLRECTGRVLDVVGGALGDAKGGDGVGGPEEARHVGMARGQFVEPAVAQVLVRAAKNGGMTRIQMDDDKRWRWVCREIADRNDRSVPKEN